MTPLNENDKDVLIHTWWSTTACHYRHCPQTPTQCILIKPKRINYSMILVKLQTTPGVHFAREGEGEDAGLTRSRARHSHTNWPGLGGLTRQGAVGAGDELTLRSNQA